MITGDNLGAIQQDGVFRGVDSMMMDVVLLEADLAALSFIYWDSDNSQEGRVALSGNSQIGKLMSTLASPLVATKITGPNASPTVITAGQAILAPGFPVRQQYANRLRRVPLRMQFLTYSSGSSIVFFTTT